MRCPRIHLGVSDQVYCASSLPTFSYIHVRGGSRHDMGGYGGTPVTAFGRRGVDDFYAIGMKGMNAVSVPLIGREWPLTS